MIIFPGDALIVPHALLRVAGKRVWVHFHLRSSFQRCFLRRWKCIIRYTSNAFRLERGDVLLLPVFHLSWLNNGFYAIQLVSWRNWIARRTWGSSFFLILERTLALLVLLLTFFGLIWLGILFIFDFFSSSLLLSLFWDLFPLAERERAHLPTFKSRTPERLPPLEPPLGAKPQQFSVNRQSFYLTRISLTCAKKLIRKDF